MDEEKLKADIMDEVESSLLSSGVLECEYNDAGSLAAAPYGTNTMLLLLLLVDDGDGGGGGDDFEPEAAWAIIRFKLFPGVGGDGGGATC